jgi:hypothetical protein
MLAHCHTDCDKYGNMMIYPPKMVLGRFDVAFEDLLFFFSAWSFWNISDICRCGRVANFMIDFFSCQSV